MTEKESFRPCGVAALVVLLALLVIPATASANGKWHLRGFAAWVDPDLDFRGEDFGDPIRAETDSKFGFGFAAEYQMSRRWGVEFSALTASPETQVTVTMVDPAASVTAVDDQSFTPLSAGVNIHLTPKSRVDLYFGAFLAYVLYSDLTFQFQTILPANGTVIRIDERVKIKVDDDIGVGALLGVDIPFGEGGWGVTGSIRYLDTDLDATDEDGDNQKISFDPLIATFGIKYSF